jgi:hypothetical protein
LVKTDRHCGGDSLGRSAPKEAGTSAADLSWTQTVLQIAWNCDIPSCKGSSSDPCGRGGRGCRGSRCIWLSECQSKSSIPGGNVKYQLCGSGRCRRVCCHSAKHVNWVVLLVPIPFARILSPCKFPCKSSRTSVQVSTYTVVVTVNPGTVAV